MARIFLVKVANPHTGIPWVGYHRGTRHGAVLFGKTVAKRIGGNPGIEIRRVRKPKPRKGGKPIETL